MSTRWFGSGRGLRAWRVAAWLVIPALATGCAEDRDGDDRAPYPIADPTAGPRATTAFESVARLEALTGSLAEVDSLAAVYGVFESSEELLRLKFGARAPSAPPAAPKGTGTPCITASPRRITVDRCTDAGASVVLDGEFRFTDSTVSGVIAVDVQSGSGATADYHLQATYDVVRTAGCATGGTIEVSATGEFSGSRFPIGYVHVRAEFGPACGDVTVY